MIPTRTLTQIGDQALDIASGTIKVALLKSTTEYNPDPDAHEFVSDVLDAGTTGAEFDDTNYSRQTLANAAWSEDNVDSEAVYDADDVVFSSLGSSTGGQEVEAVLIYKQIGGDDTTPGDDPIIRIFDDSEEADLPKQTNGEDFAWSFDAEGIINLTPQ